MILNDEEIFDAAHGGMIKPFVMEKTRTILSDVPAISYGLGHFGYDLRLSPKDFKIFQHVPGTVINPKQFNPNNLIDAELHHDEWGDYFIIPGHSYGLGVALERLKMPNDTTAIAIGKSTYARLGLIVNVTPSEAGWEGHLTIEISNSSPADVRVFANEGILQLLFLKGNPCNTAYGDGKYQQQGEQVTLARI